MHRLEIKHFRLLVTPSLLSGFMTVVAMLVLTVVVILSVHYKSGLLHQSLEVASGTSATTYQQFASHFDNSKLLANVPLLVFWGCVGLIVYYFAIGLYQIFATVAETKAELSYVNARRDQLRELGIHLLVRLATLGVWLLYVHLFLHQLLPYALAGIRAVAAGGSPLPLEIARLIGGFALGLLAIHLHVIFLRLLVLRPRLWGVDYSE